VTERNKDTSASIASTSEIRCNSILLALITHEISRTTLLLLLLNVFDDAPVCRHVKDESWAQAVTWRTTEMQVSKDEYVMTV